MAELSDLANVSFWEEAMLYYEYDERGGGGGAWGKHLLSTATYVCTVRCSTPKTRCSHPWLNSLVTSLCLATPSLIQ